MKIRIIKKRLKSRGYDTSDILTHIWMLKASIKLCKVMKARLAKKKKYLETHKLAFNEQVFDNVEEAIKYIKRNER